MFSEFATQETNWQFTASNQKETFQKEAWDHQQATGYETWKADDDDDD
jgi:hypothetical protein